MVSSSGLRVGYTVERELKFGETEWVAMPWLPTPLSLGLWLPVLFALSSLLPIPMGFESQLKIQWLSETSFQISVCHL